MVAEKGTMSRLRQKQTQMPHNLEPRGQKVWPILPVGPGEHHPKDLLGLTLIFSFRWPQIGNVYSRVYHGEPLGDAAKSKLADKFATFLKTWVNPAPKTPPKRKTHKTPTVNMEEGEQSSLSKK
jgi:hypothetical protein